METFGELIVSIVYCCKFAPELESEVTEIIASAAEKLFNKYGVRSVTMDDVAKELSISKKTLYQHFADKDALIKLTIERHIHKIQLITASIHQEHSHPIDQIVGIAEFVMRDFKSTNPSLLYDLKKYHVECWNLYKDHKDSCILNQVLKNFEEGQNAGLYRSNMNIELIARIYLQMFEFILNPEGFNASEFNFENRFRDVINYHFHGICTPKGIEYLKANEVYKKYLQK